MNKIFLVTYPDFYHAESNKIALVNLLPEEKLAVQEWLSKSDSEIVIYLYDNNNQVDWLLSVINQVDSIYINVDNSTDLSYHYISYVLAKTKTSWSNSRINYMNINKGQVRNINEFMERQ